MIIAFSIATALHIVLGELAPKSIALQRAEGTALLVTAPLDIFLKLFRPFIATLNGIGNGLVRLIGLDPVGGHGAVHSVEELDYWSIPVVRLDYWPSSRNAWSPVFSTLANGMPVR